MVHGMDAAKEAALTFYRAFRSARTTASIIGALVVLFFLGLVVPQKAFFESRQQYEAWKQLNPVYSRVVEALQLNEVHVAPITIIFLSLFFLNLVVVVSSRIPNVLRRAYLLRGGGIPVNTEGISNDSRTRSIEFPGRTCRRVLDEAGGLLGRRFWKLLPGESGFVAFRNRYSPVGFLFFHASFLLCLIGGLLVMYTRFSGNLMLTEGQRFDGDMRQFWKITREPKVLKEIPSFGIMLDKVTPHYEKAVATGLEVNMRFRAGGHEEKATVGVNQPVKRGSIAILSQRIGVSPLFVLRNEEGKTLDGGYISLNVLHGEEDSFEFPDAPYRFFVRFYPDYAVEDGAEFTRSMNMRNPVARIKVAGPAGKVKEQAVPMGGALQIDGFSVAFEDVRYWVDFLVIREYGTIPLSIGFLMGAIGLVMRLVLYQKKITVFAREAGGKTVLYLLGESEYYQYSFSEEMERLSTELRDALGQAPPGVVPEGGKGMQ